MLDERAFLARLEAADTAELTRILARPSAREEAVLRAHLGEARYRRLHGLALRQSVVRAARRPRGNVVVIHGIMGSDLSAISRTGAGEHVWVSVPHLIAGRIAWLRLGEDGKAELDATHDVRATGIMKRTYGELLLTLSERWTVRAFWFDWRKDLRLAADALHAELRGWFEPTAPVHIVAHSMGGLVARTFIKSYPERWASMWDATSDGAAGGRLVMLGTPNHGSFAIPQVMTGLEPTVRKLARLDLRHGLPELLPILNSFVGSYQMLPSPLALPRMAPLYRAETYRAAVLQRHLDTALRHHESLAAAIDPERMICVAGDNQPTFHDITDLTRVDALEAYAVTTQGDGRVPHALGRLRGVPTYYIDESHGDLPGHASVLAALDELLETGATRGLPAGGRGRGDARVTSRTARARLLAEHRADEELIRVLANRMAVRSAGPTAPAVVGRDERRIEEVLTRGFLSHRPEEVEQPMEEMPARVQVPFKSAPVEIGLHHGRIDEIEAGLNGRTVDAIAVGHYIGVRPQAAELSLDRAVSRVLPGRVASGSGEADLLLTQYSERGTIRGELGLPFFLPDPRRASRLIAIAGMGVPGRFGAPELAVLARELCWVLGRAGKRHLATVLIGSGNGNLSAADAVAAWIRGIKHAVTGSLEDEHRTLRRVTFVESDPRKLEAIDAAILDAQRRLAQDNRLTIRYKPIDAARRRRLGNEARRRDREERNREWARRGGPRGNVNPEIPVRVTLRIEHRTYHFGAITETASIPERSVPLDPGLVMTANDELVGELQAARQLERGQFLERLLVPEDLRPQLSGSAPVVMLLDATTARIHWEMVAQSWLEGPARGVPDETAFLGTGRGLTRQLRTTFAPPPEPPPPPRRVLRVLVVGDPAEDAPLPGAQAEAAEVADLFERFSTAYGSLSDNRVEVVRLFGPREATRTTVLRHLMLRSYDVLHFAGHCVYAPEDPASSGWIFTGGERLSANELNRIDRVPRFVFSNACESGITPDRAEMRTAALAPSFAEAFFARGVSNFVCTAWPVDDVAARLFALRVYGGLLGLAPEDEEARRHARCPVQPMHVAMREARLAVFRMPGGGQTWGAYQHYGNPYFRFFDPATIDRARAAPAPAAGGRRRRRIARR